MEEKEPKPKEEPSEESKVRRDSAAAAATDSWYLEIVAAPQSSVRFTNTVIIVYQSLTFYLCAINLLLPPHAH